MSEKKNYAKFRRELLNLCPGMGEQEVYLNWWKYQCRDNNWQIQQKPMWGCGKKYHMVYLTKTGLGEIYVGVHSTLDLNDGYNGSGVEIQKLKFSGASLETTPLEFFRTREEALAMEAHIVDREFIIENGVLNHTLGGDDSRHNAVQVQPKVPDYQLPKEACDVIDSFGTDAVPTPEPVKTQTCGTNGKKGSFHTFAMMDIEVGEVLTFAKDESIACRVLDRNCMVEYKGKKYKLTDLTKQLLVGQKLKYTTLGFWKHRGRFLQEIVDELKKAA